MIYTFNTFRNLTSSNYTKACKKITSHNFLVPYSQSASNQLLKLTTSPHCDLSPTAEVKVSSAATLLTANNYISALWCSTTTCGEKSVANATTHLCLLLVSSLSTSIQLNKCSKNQSKNKRLNPNLAGTKKQAKIISFFVIKELKRREVNWQIRRAYHRGQEHELSRGSGFLNLEIRCRWRRHGEWHCTRRFRRSPVLPWWDSGVPVALLASWIDFHSDYRFQTLIPFEFDSMEISGETERSHWLLLRTFCFSVELCWNAGLFLDLPYCGGAGGKHGPQNKSPATDN